MFLYKSSFRAFGFPAFIFGLFCLRERALIFYLMAESVFVC